MATFTFNEEQAAKADNAANKLTEQGDYVGAFKRVWGITAQSGAEGMEFEFEVPGNGSVIFSLYLRKEEGGETRPLFGANYLNAIMYMMGIKELDAVPGTVERYDEEAKERVEVEGDTYPQLCGKPIGLVFQKELFSKQAGGTGERLSLYGVFQPESKLMFSELREKKTRPEKLARLLKGLKVKDQRKAEVAQPSQPSLGGVSAGDF